MDTGNKSFGRRISDVLHELHSCQTWSELERFALEGLHKFVGADRASWTEFHERQNVRYFEWSKESRHLKADYFPIIGQFLSRQHPGMSKLDAKSRWKHSYRISDLMPQREFERTELFNEGYLPTGCRYQVTLQVHTSDFGLSTLSYSRLDREFDNKEREIFDCFIPHFHLITRRLLRDQCAQEFLASAPRTDSADAACLAFDQHFFLYDANATALKLLQSLPCYDGLRLPPEIVAAVGGQALGQTAINSLVLLGGKCFGISGAASHNPIFRYVSLMPQDPASVIRGRADRPKLTRRELEIAVWVKQGKTNREIAVILGISPRTISKHVENIFTKLDIDSRYALMTS